ncbi:hypothetical protein [Nonomuraea phyllanthi]|uniref:hypothetical protein n=1 Tax=Nonomuraea phyllanthi TaxID=2219224 RepID=UPI001D00E965|nr:hypothetical protein [Nonomuraea phyllanthi]
MVAVVPDQGAERTVGVRAQPHGIPELQEKPRDAEIVEGDRAAAPPGMAGDSERAACRAVSVQEVALGRVGHGDDDVAVNRDELSGTHAGRERDGLGQRAAGRRPPEPGPARGH